MDWGSILNNALSILAAIAGITGITGVTIFTAMRKNRQQSFPQDTKTTTTHEQSSLSQSLPTSLTRRQWGDILNVALWNTLTSKDLVRVGMPTLLLFFYALVGLLITGFIYVVLFLFDINSVMNDKVSLKVWLVSSFVVAFIRFITIAVDYRDELLGKKQATTWLG